jgi:hypothetical protein
MCTGSLYRDARLDGEKLDQLRLLREFARHWQCTVIGTNTRGHSFRVQRQSLHRKSSQSQPTGVPKMVESWIDPQEVRAVRGCQWGSVDAAHWH